MLTRNKALIGGGLAVLIIALPIIAIGLFGLISVIAYGGTTIGCIACIAGFAARDERTRHALIGWGALIITGAQFFARWAAK